MWVQCALLFFINLKVDLIYVEPNVVELHDLNHKQIFSSSYKQLKKSVKQNSNLSQIFKLDMNFIKVFLKPS